MSASASVAGLLAGLVLLGAPAALPADDTPSPSESASMAASPSPSSSVTPSQVASSASPTPSAPVSPNVVELKQQVLTLHANVVDLAGVARVSTTAEKIDVTLNSNVLFGKDSAKINAKARTRLAEIGKQLKDTGPGTLQIVGYTDDLGSAEHGLVLSTQRATAVQQALAPYLAGFDVTVSGKGEASPVVPNTSEQNRARNRRVELHFSKH